VRERMKRVRVEANYYASLSWHIAVAAGLAEGRHVARVAPVMDEAALRGLEGAFEIKPPNTISNVLPLLYHIPAVINPSDQSELVRARTLISRAIEQGRIDEELKEVAALCHPWEWDHLMARLRDGTGETKSAVERFLDTCIDMWDKYKEIYESEMGTVPWEDYEQAISEVGIISQWEETFGIEYPETEFVAALSVNTPLISLGPDGITVGVHHRLETLIEYLIHEVGVRIPSLKDIANDRATAQIARDDWDGLLRLIEAEACFRKRAAFPGVFGTDRRDDMADSMELSGVLAVRPSEAESETIYDHYRKWYFEAKTERALTEEG
jgi:hypothetical protein